MISLWISRATLKTSSLSASIPLLYVPAFGRIMNSSFLKRNGNTFSPRSRSLTEMLLCGRYKSSARSTNRNRAKPLAISKQIRMPSPIVSLGRLQIVKPKLVNSCTKNWFIDAQKETHFRHTAPQHL